MTKKLKTLAAASIAVCAALASLPSYAQLANSGLYIGGNVGPTKYRGDDIGGFTTDRSDKGGKLYAGYEFTPNVALELGYADLGSYTSAIGSADGQGAFLDVVGKVPFTPQLSGIARLGAFNGKVDGTLAGFEDSATKTTPKVGLGLQYDFTKNVALRGEWERYRFEAFGEKSNVDLATIGVKFRF